MGAEGSGGRYVPQPALLSTAVNHSRWEPRSAEPATRQNMYSLPYGALLIWKCVVE
ncbi:hypothetical protein UY3_02121 [Chelonia mydas]|uniref:Uncharacterized protein n=1 Tax=Chelonia mydas TaxID=8469 RepID=M7BRX1_CHEMY|nr:hypothetical protein UY3_02121 [Chelonia mydas]